MILLLGVGAPMASAAPKAGPGWGYKTTFGGDLSFLFGTPRTPVAVDASGNLYAVNQSLLSVSVYSPTPDGGTLLTEFSTGFMRNIAVDASGGTVYADENGFGEGKIRRYVSDGAPTPTYSPDPAFGVPQGENLAVDPTNGNLLVADPDAESVRRYDTTGTLLETIATPSTNPAWIATAPDGSFWVASSEGPDVIHFSGTGTQLGSISAVGPLRGLAYDASSSLVVVAVGEELRTYSAGGELLAKSPVHGGVGLAISASGSLYQVEGSLAYYVPGTAPGVAAPLSSGISSNSAQVSAEVDPGAGPPDGSMAHFEYSEDGGQTWPFETPQMSVQRTESGQPDTVKEDLTGLKPNTDYLVRLVAGNAVVNRITSSATLLHTALGPPEVETGSAISVTTTEAELTGRIDTIGGQTTYHFEYGLTSSYGNKVPTGTEAPAGNGRIPRTVSRPISGLQPDTTYHFRLVATNAAGTTHGPDRTFSTAETDPPSRSYEQVTPVDKRGGVVNTTLGFQAAADGSALSYTLSAAPTNAQSAVIFTRYLSRRGSDDWLSWTPTDPPIKAPRGIIEATTQAVSSDFTHALVVSNRALAPGAVDGGGNIYVVDLEAQDYTLVGSAPGFKAYVSMSELQSENMFLAGAPDFSWVTFTSPKSLLPGAPMFAMYRWSLDEGLTLQSSSTYPIRRPDSGNELTSRWVSDDGDVMYYDIDETSSLSSGEGAVYRHDLNGATTPVSVAEAGGDVPAGTVVNATLDGISRDGRYAIIRTQQRLTDDNPPSLRNIWMYRADSQSGDIEFIGQPINTVAGAVYAVGDNASTVFFAADSGGSQSWHNGVTHTFTTASLDFSAGLGVQHFTSPNGRYLAYVDSQDGSVHFYDAETENDVCVSCPLDGGDGGRDFGLPGGTRTISNRVPLVVSNSGLMFFDTAAALISADHNGSRDVYAYQGGRLSLITPGEGNFTARFADATPDGSVVYFTTAQSLVGQDIDRSIDVYASRVGSVFDQSVTLTSGCAGEACQKQLPSGSGELGLGSSASKGAGNPVEATVSAIRKLSQSELLTLARGKRARLRLTVSGAGTVRATGTAMIDMKKRQVVSASVRAEKAGPVGVPFKVSKAGLSALESEGSLVVFVTVKFKDSRPKMVKFTLRSAKTMKGGRS